MTGEIKLDQALPLVAELADDMSKEGWIARLRIDDPFIRVYALSKLLEIRGVVPNTTLQLALDLARHSGHLRRKLAPVLVDIGRFEWADELCRLESQSASCSSISERNITRAIIENSADDQIHGFSSLFFEHCDPDYLYKCVEIARESYSWKKAFPFYLRLLFVRSPPHTGIVFELLRNLERNGACEKFRLVGSATKNLKGSKLPTAFWIAQTHYWNKDYQRCIDYLEKSNALKIEGNLASSFYHLYAISKEKLGKYRCAAEAFRKQNWSLSTEKYTASRYLSTVEEQGSLSLPNIPHDYRTNYFIMTGFPRSGTTLLENALDVHRNISTAEETSALSSTFSDAFKRGQENTILGDLTSCAIEHRSRYYRLLDRHLEAKCAVKIDKSPPEGAFIKYLEKILPNKRYIFSIRHPYDVALSNFKQRYKQNAAMAAFNEIGTTCQLYDYVMQNWFQVFPGDTDRVCYVYYDELVTNFEPTVRRVVEFLGVEWDDAVLDFAEHSKKRAVRTPSYANVRKGLSLGVQSSYQNYLFLFDDYCRSKLDPWVEFFGYTVEDPKK